MSGAKVKSKAAAFLESAADEAERSRRTEALLLTGVHALLVFVQANWTGSALAFMNAWIWLTTRPGPELEEDIRKVVPTSEFKEAAREGLQVDGEIIHPLTRYLNFLQHARWILHDEFCRISSVKVAV